MNGKDGPEKCAHFLCGVNFRLCETGRLAKRVLLHMFMDNGQRWDGSGFKISVDQNPGEVFGNLSSKYDRVAVKKQLHIDKRFLSLK